MTVAAPPKPQPVSGAAGNDATALIEEARQRARRRRWIYGGIAGIAAVAVVVAFSAFGGTSAPPRGARDVSPRSEPIAPLVAGPDAASTLLTSWGRIHVGYAFVYADGRVIWYPDMGARVDAELEVAGAQRRQRADGAPAPDGQFRYEAIERRLSPHGLELVRAGRFTPREFLVSDPDDPDPQRRAELWAEPTPRKYEASTYAICRTPAGLLSPTDQLPASAEVLLSRKQRAIDPRIGWSPSDEPMPGYFQLLAESRVAFPSECFEVTAAEASTLYQFLAFGSSTTQSAGVPREWFFGARAAEIRGSVFTEPLISSSPIYPHGQTVAWGG